MLELLHLKGSYDPESIFENNWGEGNVTEASFEKIIFMRDPLNMAASTYNIYKSVSDNPSLGSPEFVRSNLQQFGRLSRFLTSGVAQDKGFKFIYANRFWSDTNYRDAALRKIGFEGSQFSSKMSFYGGGGELFFWQ